MTDLTKITTPFGLLDAETQEALRAHGGPWEVYITDTLDDCVKWIECLPIWKDSLVIRVKPQPPKPREWWIVSHVGALLLYTNRSAAQASAADHGGELIHVREVLK